MRERGRVKRGSEEDFKLLIYSGGEISFSQGESNVIFEENFKPWKRGENLKVVFF